MSYQLRANVHFCWIGQVPYFLDLDADRYFRLAGPSAEHFRALADGHPIVQRDAHGLIEAGAIIACDGLSAPIRAAPVRPCVDALFDRPVEPAPPSSLLVRALYDLLCATCALRFQSLAKVFDAVVRKKTLCGGSICMTDIEQVASAYRRLDLIFSPEKGCLRRSVAMARTMLRFGGGFDVVVGVRSGPFGAHCWIMRDGLVLNDRLDKVREFTPILVL